ncbi:response regulator transcription factor [Ulvibacterium sp.]|uniref:response regulator transcription factor n=1 Tax=Ulvibacterium sp. TaxID=2665914 RepID=UPI003BAA2EB2
MESKKIREIYKVFDSKNRFLAQSSVGIDRNKLNRLLENLYSPGPSFQYIFDFPNRKFDFVSEGCRLLFGEDPSTFSPDGFVHRIHPDDIPHYVRCQEIAAHFLFSHIEKEHIPHYKVSFQFRIKDINEEYKQFLHQAIALAMDEEHNMSSVFANHSDIDHLTKVNNRKMSFINVLGGKSYFGIGDIDDLNKCQSQQVFSTREVEVLKLVSEGFSSKEIADYLYISADTVRTHRKNVLGKTGFKNMAQAITYCIRDGLI